MGEFFLLFSPSKNEWCSIISKVSIAKWVGNGSSETALIRLISFLLPWDIVLFFFLLIICFK